MKITRRQLRNLIAEQVGQFTSTGPDTSRALKPDQIMALIQGGHDVSEVDIDRLTKEMIATLKNADLWSLGDEQEHHHGADPDDSGIESGAWSEGQRLSKLIQTLQGFLDNSDEDPFVRTFIGDGADIESEASSVFSLRDKDDEYAQEMNITGPTLAIIVDK
jgi:hypothetical protein